MATNTIIPKNTGFAFSALLVSCLCACATTASGGSSDTYGAPQWVMTGARITDGSIYGVGIVSNVDNKAVSIDTARNRGRAEISKIVKTYSASLMRDYMQSVSVDGQSEEGQVIEQATKTFFASLLRGTEQKDMWVDEDSNTFYVLMELNFERARSVVDMSPMGSRMAQWIDENGPRILEELEDDMSRRRPQAPPPPPSQQPDVEYEPDVTYEDSPPITQPAPQPVKKRSKTSVG